METGIRTDPTFYTRTNLRNTAEEKWGRGEEEWDMLSERRTVHVHQQSLPPYLCSLLVSRVWQTLECCPTYPTLFPKDLVLVTDCCYTHGVLLRCGGQHGWNILSETLAWVCERFCQLQKVMHWRTWIWHCKILPVPRLRLEGEKGLSAAVIDMTVTHSDRKWRNDIYEQ